MMSSWTNKKNWICAPSEIILNFVPLFISPEKSIAGGIAELAWLPRERHHNIPWCSLFVTSKFCISIVFSFFSGHFNSQEKLKTINTYAKFWDDKQRALRYVMVFSGVVNCWGHSSTKTWNPESESRKQKRKQNRESNINDRKVISLCII